jgi:tetratricopeptide (TPR) repeat protein
MLDKRDEKQRKDLTAIYQKAASFEKKGMLVEAARSYKYFLSKWPEPTAYYNYAVVLKKMRSYDEAILNYRRAIALKPDYAEAYVNIGSIYFEQREFEKSLEHHDAAIQRNPALLEAYYNRGVVLQELRRHDEALADYDRALVLNPNYYLAYLNKSVILYELKRKAAAARNYEWMLRKNPAHIDANWNFGILKLSEGDFTAGWKMSESRLALHGDYFDRMLQRPRWDGQEDIAGKTIFIKWEQGFGDTIQFCRYARLVKEAGAKVVLSVQDSLARLVARLDAGITVIGENEVPAQYDYYCFLMSLPHVFGTLVETIPYPAKYLHIDEAEAARWRARLAGVAGLKVGLVWAGSGRQDVTATRRNNANRSITLNHYAPLFEAPGVVFVSLQIGPEAAQTAGHDIHDWTDELTDFAATGALIEALDLVITVDTAVAHLAASLGKTVWILVPWVSCWRWLEGRTDSPWYESVKLFRQSERGNWDPVLEAVARELRGLAGVS